MSNAEGALNDDGLKPGFTLGFELHSSLGIRHLSFTVPDCFSHSAFS